MGRFYNLDKVLKACNKMQSEHTSHSWDTEIPDLIDDKNLREYLLILDPYTIGYMIAELKIIKKGMKELNKVINYEE